MSWVEVILPAGELADEIAALLGSTDAVAAAGAEVRGTDVVVWAPAGEADTAAAALRQAAERLRAQGFDVDPAGVRVAAAKPEDEWRDAWKRYFHVTRVTRRIVIVPSWETYTAQDSDIVLDLDPGRAFGTGAHATTKMCMAALEKLHDENLMVRRFLDVGTGSGILSAAAAKLWPESAGVAVDVDPQAVDVARENLERNGVLSRIRVSDDGVEDVGGTFDVVVANIQADILEALRDPIVDRVAPGGALILSGLLSWQAEPVAAAYAQSGLTIVATSNLKDDDSWSAVSLRKPE